MFLTRKELTIFLRKEINKSMFAHKRKILHAKRLKFLNSTNAYFYKTLKLNNKIKQEKLFWQKYFENRKNFLNFNRTYVRSKNKQIYTKLLKYEHYILTFKSFFSNFYIMLTDNMGNPIISCSTGQVSYSRSKKRKNSMMLIYPMMQKIKSKLIKHGVKHIAIHIRTDINSKIVTAIKFLNYSKLKFNVTYIALLKPIAHHFGRRKKKPRRI